MLNNFDYEFDRSEMSTMKWEAEKAKRQKNDLLCFGTADMDYVSPDPIRKAIDKVVQIGHFGYPYIKDSYYESIIQWFDRNVGWEINETQIATNVGIYTSVWTIIDAITDPGDEIIYQPPVHFCFKEIIENNDRIAVKNPLIIKDGEYTMDFDSLENSISEKSKAFWLCNPHNPVGRAWNKQELKKLADICLNNNLKIITDDVYCGLVYPGKEYTPIASLSGKTANNTITCVSPSKPYNVTGIKHSYVIIQNKEIMESYNNSLKKLDLTYGMNIIGLAATEAAYNECDGWLKDLMKYIEGNYKYLQKQIKDHMPLIEVIEPDATYFVWLDFRRLMLSREQMEKFFEDYANIVVEYGHKFGVEGEGFIRMNIACTRKTLEEGIERMINAYEGYLSQDKTIKLENK